MSALASPSEEVELTPAGAFLLRRESRVTPCGLRWGEYPPPPHTLLSFVERGQGCQPLPSRWATLFKETLTLTLISLARLKGGDELRDPDPASFGLQQQI